MCRGCHPRWVNGNIVVMVVIMIKGRKGFPMVISSGSTMITDRCASMCRLREMIMMRVIMI